jgi:poly(ADP-ribose) glycohydrolase
LEKLKCILHYFAEFMRRSPSGCISIIRQQIAEHEKLEWSKMEMPLAALTVMPTGKIEDEGEQMTQLDFANQYIGGGVLGHGCVQVKRD